MKDATAFVRFVLIGGFASGVNLVARILIDTVTSYAVAILLAFFVGLTTAFLLNRMFVFKPASQSQWRGEFFRFLLVNLATLAQVFLLSMLFARVIFPATGMDFHPDTIAHGIGLITPVFTSFWAHRHFTFRAASLADGPAE